MRIANAIFVGSMATLLATPAPAKTSNPQKTEESSAAPACHASIPAANGPGIVLPCEEVISGQAQHKPASRNAEAKH